MEKEMTCPCKRTHCMRHGDCDNCYTHHHLPGKKLLTACERVKKKREKKEYTNEKSNPSTK